MEQSPSWEANRFAASQEIPPFYGTRRFITALASARHLSLFLASSIQSTPPHPTSWRSILILSSHLCLGLPTGEDIIKLKHKWKKCEFFWFLLHTYITMHGSKNVKSELLLVKSKINYTKHTQSPVYFLRDGGKTRRQHPTFFWVLHQMTLNGNVQIGARKSSPVRVSMSNVLLVIKPINITTHL